LSRRKKRLGRNTIINPEEDDNDDGDKSDSTLEYVVHKKSEDNGLFIFTKDGGSWHGDYTIPEQEASSFVIANNLRWESLMFYAMRKSWTFCKPVLQSAFRVANVRLSDTICTWTTFVDVYLPAMRRDPVLSPVIDKLCKEPVWAALEQLFLHSNASRKRKTREEKERVNSKNNWFPPSPSKEISPAKIIPGATSPGSTIHQIYAYMVSLSCFICFPSPL